MTSTSRRQISAFFADFDAATVPCPVGWRTSRMFPDVPVSIILGDEATYVTINYLQAHLGTRATGAGTEAMRRILDLADKHGVTVFLDPVPLDDGWSWARLIKWYASFGFVFEEAENNGGWMMRRPDAKGARRPNPRTRARRRADFPKAYWELVALAPVLQDRIYDYFKPLRHLDGANEMLAQMLRDAGYRVIGVGGVRVVVDVGEGFAAKVACDAYGDQQNRAEAAFWKAHPLPDLMPVHAFSQDGSIKQDGTVLLTERAETPVSEAEARAGWERLAKHPQGRLIGETDFPFQWGRHGGKVKLLDYGDSPLRPNPRRNPSLGERLYTALREDAAFGILDADPDLAGCDWGCGGCAVLAAALLRLLPSGSLFAVVQNGEPQHYLVRYRGLFYDENGGTTESVFWRLFEAANAPSVSRARGARLVALDRDTDVAVGGIFCPLGVVDALTVFLAPRLGVRHPSPRRRNPETDRALSDAQVLARKRLSDFKAKEWGIPAGWQNGAEDIRNAEAFLEWVRTAPATFRVYRALRLRDPSYLHTEGIGTYWAWKRSGANVYQDDTSGVREALRAGEGNVYLVVGEVNTQHVDWERTFFKNLYDAPWEHEIEVVEGSPIRVVGMFFVEEHGRGRDSTVNHLRAPVTARANPSKRSRR